MPETKGNTYNCECPYCGKINNYIYVPEGLTPRSVMTYEATCFHCHKIIMYFLEYEITVKAYTEDTMQAELGRKFIAERKKPKVAKCTCNDPGCCADHTR